MTNLVEIGVNNGVQFINNLFDPVAEGFLVAAANAIPDKAGVLWPRSALVDTSYHSSTSVGTFGSYGAGMTNFNVLQLGEGSLAAAIWFNAQSATGGLRAINKPGGPTTNATQFAFNYGAPSFCEYNNIIYASTLASGVRKITVLNFAGPSITEVLVAGSPNLTGIISFKNRLFGWNSQNRIYYTDVPGPGLLPETWNTAVNFFDVPGFRGTPTIHSLLTIENRIFIFTDSGLFTVLISGPPSTWVLRSLDDTISVDNRYAAFVFRNVLYFVDDVSVWASDGSDFRNIGEDIAPALRNLYGIGASPLMRKRLFRFGNKLILSLRQNVGGAHAGTNWICDMETFKWSGFNMRSDGNDNALTEAHGVLTNLKTRQYSAPQNYILLSTIRTGSLEDTYLFTTSGKPGIINNDSILGVPSRMWYYFKTRFVDFGFPDELKHVNFAVLDFMYFNDPTAISWSWWVDGERVQGTYSCTVPLTFPVNMRVRIPGPMIPFREIQLEVAFDRPVTFKRLLFDLGRRGPIDEQQFNGRF